MQNLNEAELLRLATAGNKESLNILFSMHRERLRRMVESRLDQRVRARIDASDVIQEVHVEATLRLAEYSQQPSFSFFHWLRFLAKQKMIECVRRNVHAQIRDVRREQPMDGPIFDGGSKILAGYLMGSIASPSAAIARAELQVVVERALDQLEESDREILTLRHVELLSTTEAATELEISPSACRQRHLRALRRLKELLQGYSLDFSGG